MDITALSVCPVFLKGVASSVKTLTTRYSAIVLVVGNLAFLSWFVNKYAHHFLIQVGAVNAVCIWIQKAGAAIAFGNLGWITRGKGNKLERLSTFDAKKHPAYLAGFAINRIGSLTPPLYTLGVTWGKLPLLLMLYLALDAAVALWTALHFETWIRETAVDLATYRHRKEAEKR